MTEKIKQIMLDFNQSGILNMSINEIAKAYLMECVLKDKINTNINLPMDKMDDFAKKVLSLLFIVKKINSYTQNKNINKEELEEIISFQYSVLAQKFNMDQNSLEFQKIASAATFMYIDELYGFGPYSLILKFVDEQNNNKNKEQPGFILDCKSCIHNLKCKHEFKNCYLLDFASIKYEDLKNGSVNNKKINILKDIIEKNKRQRS